MNMVRYADDFIITGHSKEWLEHEVKPAVIEFLAERGLVLSPEKTIREVIKANKTAKQANLIRLLNPILRGWANYHSHVVAKRIFGRVDDAVWSTLWRWAVRRHPKKGTRWVKNKYFKTNGSRDWVFAATEKKEDGTTRELILLKESDTPIKRHVKIQAAANPHDPQWDRYFESRWGQKMLHSPRGRGKLYRVWRRQDGLCSTCQQPITKNTRWDVQHLVKRTDGGTDAASNLRMQHLNCRRTPQYADD